MRLRLHVTKLSLVRQLRYAAQPDMADLTFLHLSDIHFRGKGAYAFAGFDEYVRNELMRDLPIALELAQKDRIDGVWVSGDIAYSGQNAEYLVAREFLENVCRRCNCDLNHVWLIPGNHDVDRSQVEGSEMIQGIHMRLRSESPPKRDEIVFKLWETKDRTTFLQPLAKYEAWAKAYATGTKEETARWWYDFALNDGSTLRLWGLNSALISDESDNKDKNRLLLSIHQRLFPREDGVAHAVMCHHPPDWLLDGEDLVDQCAAAATLEIYGHKHILRLEKRDERLVLSAGALHPDLGDGPYEPRYNILTFGVKGTIDARHLHVDVYPRQFISGKYKFDRDPKYEACVPYDLALPNWTPPATISVESSPDLLGGGDDLTAAVAPEREHMQAERKLAYAFYTLDPVEVMVVAKEVGLLHSDDSLDASLTERVFLRAKAERRFAELWESVKQKTPERLEAMNPFTGKE
jgi:hypothetical protein